MTAAANAAFFGFDNQRDGYMAPDGMTLDTLYFQYQQWQQNGSQGTFTTTNPLIHLNGNSVLVEATATANIGALVTSLQGLGMQVTGVVGPDVSGWMPIGQLANLAMTSGLNFAQQSSYFVSAPADSTQGAKAIGATTAQTQFGVTGTGITVGILSDSFNSTGGYSTDVANGQLPGNVINLADAGGTDEGRAMTQIVYAEAPGAQLAFATASGGSPAFAQNILALQSQAHANVEVDDVGYFDQPFFQEGIIAQAADAVAARGVAYFSAAGNDGSQAWQGAFNSTGNGMFPGSTLNNFGGGTVFQQVTIPVGSDVTFDFQWSQPFASVGGKGNQSQMDMFLSTNQGGFSGINIVAEGINNTVGGDAEQLFNFFNDGSFGTQTFFISIEHDSGPVPTVMKYMGLTDGLPFLINTFATNSGTTFGQPVALGAAGVGAAAYTNTPAFGVTPPILESFSSTGGGTEFLFDTAGNALPAPLPRNQPLFTGVDGDNLNVANTNNEFDPFFGTSAAAPSVAGVAALMLQEAGGAGALTPSQIYQLMQNTATPMSSTPGFNSNFGFGLVNGVAAVQAAQTAPKSNLPTATLSVTTNPLAEQGGTTQVIATLSKVSTSPVTIALQFSGSAATPAQYQASATTITIPAGQTFGSITLTGVNDGLVTGNLTIIVTIFSATNARIAGGSQSVTIIRTDSNTPGIGLALSGGGGPDGKTLFESGGTLTVTATLTQALIDPIQVNLGFSGTAILGTNYSASALFITIAAGKLSGSITLTGIPNTIPNLPAASLFVTIESIVDTTQNTTLNVPRVPGAGTAQGQVVDNFILGNPFGQNPVVSLPTTPNLAISDMGGTTTITISQSTTSQVDDRIELLFSGTGVYGTNYIITDAGGNQLGSKQHPFGEVVIPRGQLSTTITVTGLDSGLIGPDHTVIISLGTVSQGQPSPTNNSITVTILQLDSKPAVGLTLSQPVFTQGGQIVVTATLLQTTNVDVFVNLSFTGTATPNIEYSVTDGPGGPATDQIRITAGQPSGSVTLTGLDDKLNRAETTVTVGIASVTGAVVQQGFLPVTANYVNARVPVTFSVLGTVTLQGGVAAVQVNLSRPVPFPVSVDYLIANGTAFAGAQYLLPNGSASGTLNFAAEVTQQTIFITTIPSAPSGTTSALNFTVSLDNPSLDVPVLAAPPPAGATIGNGTAIVSIIETSTVTQSSVAATLQSGGASPPDIAAAVGTATPPVPPSTPGIPPRIVVMTNDQYTVYDYNSGFIITQTTLDQFWINAGLSGLTGDAVNPRVEFNPILQRFFAVAINPVGGTNNNVLFAVSKTQDPLGGWSAFTLPVDPTAKVFSATGVALGMDANAIYITADLVNPIFGNTSETGFSIPISNFNNGAAATTNFTQYFNIPSGFELQPEFNPTFNPSQPEALLSGNSSTPNALLSFIIAGGNNANAAISPPTAVPIPGGGPITDPNPAPQPDPAPPISDGPAGFSGTIYQSVNDIWAVETVADASGRSDIRWYEISVTSGQIQQTGLIKDPNLSFYNASVAALTDVGVGDQVVISFTGSGPNQFASAYAVIGQTTGPLNNQLTTFTTPILLTPGAGSYNVPVNGVNAWGNYSSTVADPNFAGQRFGVSGGQAVFWTFQEFASAPNVWSVEMVQIVVAIPVATPLPQVSLSSTTGETIEEDLGTATISAVLSAATTDNVEVSLVFGGTAIQNQQYVPSATTIFIPAGQTSGSIILTGLPVDLFGTFSVTVSIGQATLYNATPGANTNVSLPLHDTDPVAAGNLAGTVYNDLNFDAVLDNNEPSIPNVLLFIDKNHNSSFDVASDPYIFSTAAGAPNYTFFGLANGSYDVLQIVPPQFGQTQPANGLGYIGVSPAAAGLNFGDAAVTNPPTTLSVSIPQITDDHSSGTFTITLAQRTQAAVSLTILVGGMAPFTDYTLTGPGGVIPLTNAAPTFVAVIPAGQSSVSYTITATGDTTGTNETITFRALSITNATIAGSSQVETSIVSTTGTPQLVIGSPSQVSSTGLNPGFSFGPATNTFTTANQPDFITTADLNGNGIPDLIVANSQASSITVILDPTSANPVTKSYPVGPNPTGIVAADFNGDGALDLAISTANGVTVLQNNGFGGFTLSGGYATGSAPSAVTAGDFNGDGKVDIAVANMNSNTVSILYGNGNMTFKAAVNIAVGQAPTDIKAVALTNNGILDLVVANNGSSSNSVTVLMNNGTGTFTSASYLAGVQPRSLAIADFNGDGILDIAVANVGNSPNQSGSINTVTVLFGNGTGKFTPVPLPIAGQPLPTGTYLAGPSVFSIAAGDVSGDGVPDLVVANSGVGDNSISVLTNNGNGTFSAPTLVPVGTGNLVQSVVTGDFYGNGAIDIASANSFGTAGVNGATIFKNADIPASLLFHVYLSHPATSTVTVKFATQNGTGQAFVDYTPMSGTLRFSPGTTVETVAVPILGTAGNNRTVILQLATATNAPIQIGTGVGTINPLPFAATTATASVVNGNLVVTDSTQNDSLQILQLGAGKVEILVNGEMLPNGPYAGVTGQIQVTTPQGLDNIYVDEEVTEAGVVTNSGVLVNPSFGDFVFAELLNGQSWLLQA
ncbi:MAG TPA: FG-GAP-like repeat-containing protein [Planctomycetaceae bacterium]|nr:FG-GAP-like repeat-containing protein [Planctomycetaceae bacterium]